MASNPDFYYHFRDKILQKYDYHTSAHPTATGTLFSRGNRYRKVSNKLPSSLLFSKQIKNALAMIYPDIQQEAEKEVTNKSATEVNPSSLIHSKYKETLMYNFGFAYSAMCLRSQYSDDSVLNLKDILIVIEESIELAAKLVRSADFKEFVNLATLNVGSH